MSLCLLMKSRPGDRMPSVIFAYRSIKRRPSKVLLIIALNHFFHFQNGLPLQIIPHLSPKPHPSLPSQRMEDHPDLCVVSMYMHPSLHVTWGTTWKTNTEKKKTFGAAFLTILYRVMWLQPLGYVPYCSATFFFSPIVWIICRFPQVLSLHYLTPFIRE